MSEKKLQGHKCNSCGMKMFPKRSVCPQCRRKEFSEFNIEGPGTVITFTKLYAVPKGVDEMPLILGIIEFNEGIKITGQLIDKEVRIGDKVKPVWGKLRTSRGKDVYGFKFEPLK